ncbi:formate dehydrogenase subunit delta [Microvirga pakistanensis]|uniref:formate dehydrogenase subunit delta n=1 Tax=Microvirga pakistanensis TaxID=1682650 RepID=UPI001069E604|nr:formate dehydrogenase subunit delta [Microvirga pakistanensis]
MSTEKLVRMANQIAAFFRSYPEDQALKGIHDHLVAYWTPGMRRTLLEHAGHSGQGLDPLVVKAMSNLQTGRSPIEKEIAGPGTVGQLGSDAG